MCGVSYTEETCEGLIIQISNMHEETGNSNHAGKQPVRSFYAGTNHVRYIMQGRNKRGLIMQGSNMKERNLWGPIMQGGKMWVCREGTFGIFSRRENTCEVLLCREEAKMATLFITSLLQPVGTAIIARKMCCPARNNFYHYSIR